MLLSFKTIVATLCVFGLVPAVIFFYVFPSDQARKFRVEELGDAVDHYLVVESPYTYFGTEKPLYLRNNLSAGFLREHRHKIVPISVDFYNYADGDPWGPENYFRTSVWYEGHRRLKNIRDDDLFIMSDADEIPSRDTVLFLKYHDGFGEPMKLRLRWFTYGFYWENSQPVDMKLAAAQRDDGVRWGDFAEKTDASYINSLRKKGLLFDDSPALTPCDPNQTAPAIRRRSRPRNVINGLVFNHELDLLEVRIEELGDAVDHYLVVESPYTYFGTEKPLYLRNNLSAGFLREHRHKIVPISVHFFNYAEGDPWGPENYFRTSVWYEGHRRLKDIRGDDLFIMSDADEIPSRDVVLFLKHHDGFGEPMKLRLRWLTYGFYWENSRPVDVGGVCTVAYIRNVYENDSLRLRSMRTFAQNNMPNTGTFSKMWTIAGTSPRYAGWHCSWCFDVAGIQMKLAAAQRDDGVRWGDIAEKSDTNYINSLRRKGLYFDDSSKLTPCDPNETAPAYVRENAERFMCLMRP
ncbi:hypothetical protein MTO96_025284 [Rhipicephalus appendiculatus]